MKLTRFACLAASALSGSTAFAYEVDNFALRETLKVDALPVLDRKVNQILNWAVTAANKESPRYCNRVIFRQELMRWVGPSALSVLEVWANFTGQIQQLNVASSNGVYAGISASDSPALFFFGAGRSLLVNGHVVGTDKLGHFFMQGYEYYDLEQKGEKIEDILLHKTGEDGVWGLKTSGVMSYADMAANYYGYQFWKQLHDREKPYVRCIEGKGWKKERDFTWAHYVNDAWDEAINCSSFTPEVERIFSSNLKRLGMQCPVDASRCSQLTDLPDSRYFMSPKCQVREIPRSSSG